MHKVLFVCLGNICRSPAADGVMVHLVNERGISSQFEIDSAGTSAHHVGEPADSRMREHAQRRGIFLGSISRAFDASSDFEKYDLILAMDNSNYRNILAMNPSGEYHHKVKMFCDFAKNRSESEVPDPYYGGAKGFEQVLDIVEDGVEGILKHYEQK
ncbi:low molecular weight protein-tyrosine-phosphatase [Bacteriovorax sp. DB6_IX]|uniref:low molecular weight protein-tyrosine-phosphatase n=1 Tax=Bacteriovorax sp. DB6_IX TaxID=1353530 RepID=UPI000389FE16|nr:low molecular weight protein-tyrosine-phosphatase [Bacteriovorax sp. DB6_IX]EQC48978.1 low molecular weight phosphotyrosine protein phosphatase [Bacteriovorax sp. DB6_IX]